MPTRNHKDCAERAQRNADAIRKIEADRVARGVCRHCGGPVPCWSEFGDQAVGRRHTAKSHGKVRRA